MTTRKKQRAEMVQPEVFRKIRAIVPTYGEKDMTFTTKKIQEKLGAQHYSKDDIEKALDTMFGLGLITRGSAGGRTYYMR